MSRRNDQFYYGRDEFAGEGYPYTDSDQGRYQRNPYESRSLGATGRANDPFASPRADRGDPYRGSHDEPPPIITLNRHDDQGYGSMLRHSQTPETRHRASRNRVDPFQDRFGDLDRPERGSGSRPDWGASGPARDPFGRGREAESGHLPYGGGAAPRNPFGPGGGVYDYEREEGERHPSLTPRDYSSYSDQARRRDQHYRSGMGEPGGLAAMRDYRSRRNHEQSVLRERERSRALSEERDLQREHDFVNEHSGNGGGGDFSLF